MNWGIMATATIAKTFARTIMQMSAGQEGETLAAVGSRSMESARAFAAGYGIPRAHASYLDLVNDPAVDAVYIATPNSMHYENAMLCLNAGKHVLCEKPFTTNAEDAEKLYAYAEEKGLLIMEGLWTEFLPAYQKIRELIAGGAIGEVRHVRAEYGFVSRGARKDRKFDSSLAGGALLDVGIYNLGFLKMVFGEMSRDFTTVCHINEYGTDDLSTVQFRYENGASAQIMQSIGIDAGRPAVIYGDQGKIVIPDYQHCKAFRVLTWDGTEEEFLFPFESTGFEYEIRSFSLAAAAGSVKNPEYPPEASLDILRTMDRIRSAWGLRFSFET